MARKRKAQAPEPLRLVLDAGAVIALARGDQVARAFLRRAVDLVAPVHIPAPVIAETVRGNARDAPVNRVIKAVDSVLPADEDVGRIAGSLLGAAGSEQTIDALVVATVAAVGGGRILTSDPDDLRPLAAAAKGISVLTL